MALLAVPAACGGHSRREALPITAGADATGVDEGGTSAGGAPSGAGGGGQGALAGATSAGSPTSGAGTASGGEPADEQLPEAPPGCRSVAEHETDRLCSLTFDCQDVPFFARCDQLADDRWSCECEATSGGAPMRQLLLQGVTAKTACGAMARACFQEPPAGERSCTSVSEDFSSGACSIQEACGPELELEPGILAQGGEYQGVACSQSEAGFSCTCFPPLVGKEDLSVTAPSSELACRSALDACKSGLSASVAPFSCTDQPVDPGEGGSRACAIDRSCTQLATPSEDVTLRSALERRAVCYVGEGAANRDLVCSCQEGTLSSMSFTADAGLEGACATTLDACTGATELEPAGLPECTISGKSEEEHECEARLACSRTLKLGDLKIEAEGKAWLLCRQKTTSGPWWCSCDSQGKPAIFELGPAPTAAEACYAALEPCVEKLDIGFGLHGPPPPPPPPI